MHFEETHYLKLEYEIDFKSESWFWNWFSIRTVELECMAISYDSDVSVHVCIQPYMKPGMY